MSSSPSPSTASNTVRSVRSTTRSNLRGAWLFAVLWNLVSAPILVFVPRELERNSLAAVGFIFPVIGVGLLAWAVTMTLRWRRFGPSWFDMPLPASPGGACAGTIRTRLERPPGGVQGMASSGNDRLVITLKLTCLRRVVSGHGKNRSVRENIVWREEQQVAAEHISFMPHGASIPVHFAIPADALETTASGHSVGVFWALTAEASLPGVDLHEDFDVPVRADASVPATPRSVFPEPPQVLGAEARSAKAAAVTRQDLAAAGIIVRQTEAGIEYHFGAARNPSFAIGLTVFLLIWSGALLVQIALDVPSIFSVVWGLFELLLIVVVADLWLGATTVTIGSQTIRRQHAVAGIGTTRVIPSKDVVKIELHISMQTTGRSGTPYYEIRATKADQRHLSFGSGISNKTHAEWLAREMRVAIGLAT